MTHDERIDEPHFTAPEQRLSDGESEGVGPVRPMDPSRRQAQPNDPAGPGPPSRPADAPDTPASAPSRRLPPQPPARPSSAASRPGTRRSRSAVGAVDRVRRTDFPVALRGYDRAAVDAYVGEVAQLVAELEATQLPETVVERALDDVGEQTSSILKRAHEAAEEIASRSRSQAEGRLDSAEREADLTRREAEDHVRRLEADVQSIWQERQRLIDDIRQLADDVLGLADDAIDRIPPPGGRGEDEAGAPGSMPSEVEQTQSLARDDVVGEMGPAERPDRDAEHSLEPSPDADPPMEPAPGAEASTEPSPDAAPFPEPRPVGQSPEDEDTAERPPGA